MPSCGQVLHELADEKKLVIAVGYMLRYNPAIETAKALLKEVLFLFPSRTVNECISADVFCPHCN